MKIKILISGTSGYVGFQLLQFLLRKNFQVTDLIRSKNQKLINLKKLFKKNYHSIKISNNFINKIKKKKFDCFINLATLYKKSYTISDVPKLINSNIEFPFFVLNSIFNKKIIFINFGSMMEFSNKKRSPKNIYASSKIFFEDISALFNIKKQYNIKLYETFDLNDQRDKIIPTIIKAHKKNKLLKIYNKNLKLNFVSINNIQDVLIKILNNKLKPGNYVIQNKKFTKIFNTIVKLNKNDKKINYKLYKSSKNKYILKKILFNLDVFRSLDKFLNDKNT